MDIVQIPLSQGKVALVDLADHEQLQQYQWHAVERPPNWYAGSIAARPLGYYMHRVIMQAKPGEHVDHRNGDGLDNRRANLRICTNAENRRNMRIRRGVSPYKGVWRNPHSPGRPWFAYIDFAGRRRGLGSYPTEIEAARAYNAAALELHRDFACLNIIEGLTYEGLGDVDLAGKSYNSGKKALEGAGFTLVGTTKTGRNIFENKKTGAKVYYDCGDALAPNQKPHWHVEDSAGNRYDRSGRPVGTDENAGHIPAG